MAALMKEAPTKSFFSSPSHTLKKLVNAFPKSQKQSHHPQQQQQQKLVEEEEVDDEADAADITHCLADENEDYENEEEHKQNSSAAEEDGVIDIECTGSSEGEYPRPRIREDLLPHDFSAWQKSIAPYPPSEASSTSREAESFSEVLSSSTSQERHPRINGHMKLNRNPSPNRAAALDSSPIADLHLHKVRQNLPDLKLETITHGLSATNGGSKYGGPAGLKDLPEDWKSLRNGASENSRYRSVDGSWQLRKELDSAVAGGQLTEKMQDVARTGNGREPYQNLVEMFPLIETCMEHPEDHRQRANFQHHASMVYTRAPPRETLAKKVADSANSRRASRNSRRVKKKSEAVWEEQENMPRRFKVDDSSPSPRSISYENAVDIAKLQGQVDELQRKLVVREGMLESYHHRFEEPKDESSDVMVLARRVEELQREVAEKEHMWDSAREKLTQKENEIQGIQMLLQSSDESCVGLKARNASSEEEVRALRCEVAALRWQFEIDAESMGRQGEPSMEVCNDRKFHCDTVGKLQQEPDVVEMEAVRKMYLASLVVARHVPREECLALVGVLRIQLQCFLRRPTFHIP